MDNPIPHDIEYFLTELTTFEADAPGAFEAYARAAATLLYNKYCVWQNSSMDVLPGATKRLNLA